METAEERDKGQAVFSPQEVSPEHVIVTYLMHRILQLPKEALSDLTALAPDLANCRSAGEFREIAQTIREILFPEVLIGGVHEGALGPDQDAALEKRSGWIGTRIRELRKQAELTQEQLAERSNLPQSHICRLENGHHSPSHKTLERIAKALRVRLSDLDPGEED